MADLTEQWKKGELPSGYYYCKIEKTEILRINRYNLLEDIDGEVFISEMGDCEIIAPVPSYEEWQETYNCMLENEVLRLKNAQLKELLKECKTPLEVYNEMFGNKEELLTKIDEVLK